jgi:hypothetical protein
MTIGVTRSRTRKTNIINVPAHGSCAMLRESKVYGNMWMSFDVEFLPEVSQLRWCVTKKGNAVYAKAIMTRNMSIPLHQLKCPPQGDLVPDHLNQNPFHNRRNNLQLQPPRSNTPNSGANNLGMRGVHCYRPMSYQMHVRIHNTRYALPMVNHAK